MQPIIYNSLDKSAPRLTINAGTLRTVLKACLVTGYGDKPAAGWEIAWADDVANKIALRSKNPTSIKSVLLVNDNAAASATVTAYNSWDAAKNAGIDVFGSGSVWKKWNIPWDASMAPDNPNWCCIATDKFFYFFLQGEKGPQMIMYAFGDVVSLKSNIQMSVLIAKSNTNTYNAENTLCNYANSSLSKNVTYPKYPYNTKNPTYLGDKASGNTVDGGTWQNSNIVVFVKMIGYAVFDGVWQAGFMMPGMLLPLSQPTPNGYRNLVDRITNQVGYSEILGFIQPWDAGNIWIHTNDWDNI